MAKKKICPICGKEYMDGFFGTEESGILSFGKVLEREDSHMISCCRACAERYKEIAGEVGRRFAVKLNNLRKARRTRLKEEQIGKLFVQYVRQMQTQPYYNGEEGLLLSFCHITPDGRFCATEMDTSVSDITVRGFKKSLDQILTFDRRYVFGKEDVSMLEYRLAEKEIISPFRRLHTYYIRLNDEKTMTGKPCITKFIVSGKGLLPGRAASKEMRRLMEVFRSRVGVQAPITEVKKFR